MCFLNQMGGYQPRMLQLQAGGGGMGGMGRAQPMSTGWGNNPNWMANGFGNYAQHRVGGYPNPNAGHGYGNATSGLMAQSAVDYGAQQAMGGSFGRQPAPIAWDSPGATQPMPRAPAAAQNMGEPSHAQQADLQRLGSGSGQYGPNPGATMAGHIGMLGAGTLGSAAQQTPATAHQGTGSTPQLGSSQGTLGTSNGLASAGIGTGQVGPNGQLQGAPSGQSVTQQISDWARSQGGSGHGASGSGAVHAAASQSQSSPQTAMAARTAASAGGIGGSFGALGAVGAQSVPAKAQTLAPAPRPTAAAAPAAAPSRVPSPVAAPANPQTQAQLGQSMGVYGLLGAAGAQVPAGNLGLNQLQGNVNQGALGSQDPNAQLGSPFGLLGSAVLPPGGGVYGPLPGVIPPPQVKPPVPATNARTRVVTR